MKFVSVSILFIFNNVQSIRILGVFPTASKSHYILANNLMRGLAERGHDVTIISPFSEKNLPKNGSYKDITLTGFLEQKSNVHSEDINMFDYHDVHAILLMCFMPKPLLKQVEYILAHENVQQLLKSKTKFDVVIVQQHVNDALKALAIYFDAPLVIFNTVGANSWFNSLVGNPQPLAYVPEMMLSYSSQMNFWQRLDNTITWTFHMLLNHWYIYPKQKQFVEKYLPGINFDEVLYNSSLVLVNSHPSTNQPVPYVPNMIDIGGYHVQPPKKLPQDLQQVNKSYTERNVSFLVN